MREVMDGLEKARTGRQRLALATVVRTENSAPRMIGTSMLVTEAGQPVGSVSGGCVEAAVMAAASDVLATGVPELHRFGISDDTGFEIGLTCGGTIEIFVQPYEPAARPDFASLQHARGANVDCAMVTVFEGPDELLGRSEVILRDHEDWRLLEGMGLAEEFSAEAFRNVHEAIAGGHTTSVRIQSGDETLGDISLLVDVYRSPRKLLIFGAIDFTTSLAELGRFLGFHVIVCDARSVFATAERIPAAHEIVIEQPWRYLNRQIAANGLPRDTAVCVLTHDEKFDIPVLDVALKHGFSYVGAMGSRRTDHKRRDQLADLGHTPATMASMRSPIGLDLGARTPNETALSIMAEILAVATQTSGLPLNVIDVPIHASRDTSGGRAGPGHRAADYWTPECSLLQAP